MDLEDNSEITPEATPDPVLLVDDSTKEFFEKYVGPGKKYANVGELAKGYANADTHIFEVTKDAGKFKTEAESLRELLMENLNPNPNDENNQPNPQNPPNDDPPLAQPPAGDPPKDSDEVDLKARVREALEEVDTEKRRKSNAQYTEEVSLKHFGSKEDAVAAIAAKAEELGVSPQWIANLAFDSPKAYLITMGITEEAPKSTNSPAPRSDVNPLRVADTNPAVKPNSYKWFMELRKSDPARFRSQEIQNEIMKQAQENPNFYQ